MNQTCCIEILVHTIVVNFVILIFINNHAPPRCFGDSLT